MLDPDALSVSTRADGSQGTIQKILHSMKCSLLFRALLFIDMQDLFDADDETQ